MSDFKIKGAIESGPLKITILETGDIERITYNGVQCIDLYKGDPFSGSVDNIYLRIKGTNEWTRLIGSKSPSSFRLYPSSVVYKGKFSDVYYVVRLILKDRTWFYEISFTNLKKNVEVYYTETNSLSYFMANEAYASQYLDHHYDRENETITTRQNQGDPFSLLEGSFNKIESYSTDAFQFYGKSFKITDIAIAMKNAKLSSYNYQYEAAMTAFKVNVKKADKAKVVFYASLISNYHQESHLPLKSIKKLYQDAKKERAVGLGRTRINPIFSSLFLSKDFTEEEINLLYSERLEEEFDDNGRLIAFFLKDSTHVVLKAKEWLLERPTMNLITSSGLTTKPEQTYALTSYMYGIFVSHLVLGNTSMNKFIQTVKDPLNLSRLSGVRIFVKQDEKYYELGVPSSFELRSSSSKWLYKINNDLLTITVAIAFEGSDAALKVVSREGKKYDFIVTNDIEMGPDESVNEITPHYSDNAVVYQFGKDNLAGKLESDYAFKLTISGDSGSFSDDSYLYDDNEKRSNLLLVKANSSSFTLFYSGIINGNEPKHFDPSQMISEYEREYRHSFADFHIEAGKPDTLSFNHLVYWFSHDALVHFSSPHGLEQYGGAAWGTRDVLQGPVEFFKAMGNYDMVRFILLRVYSRQFADNFDWPQWFMFDNYSFIEAQESASDIAVWPLKATADYIRETGDIKILDETVSYTDRTTGKPLNMATVREHIQNEIAHIQSTFIKGTSLPAYGNGDWDDTLNPVDREKAKRMVSPWTSALFLQALELYSGITGGYKELIKALRDDYSKYLIKNGVIAGFVRFDSDGIKYLLHPTDMETGLKYRLLPITRNMIAEEFDRSELAKYLRIIDEFLLYPDGVRLMDNTVKYHGGSSTLFMRAESAANFGREISLLYVHAHIRYLEAMAKIGEANRMYQGLSVVSPIHIRQTLKNAEYRQSCSYFSSSDAEFNDRYIANNSINKIKTQDVKVKGGWRLYSSGPGIYLFELIGNFLGIKHFQNRIYLDPVLPRSFDGLALTMTIDGTSCLIRYHVHGKNLVKVTINGKEVGQPEFLNRYRRSGISFTKDNLGDKNILDVYME